MNFLKGKDVIKTFLAEFATKATEDTAPFTPQNNVISKFEHFGFSTNEFKNCDC